MINNYAHIVKSLSSVLETSPILSSWDTRLSAAINQLVEKKLSNQFGPMIRLTLEGEKDGSRISPNDLERCVLNFQTNWKTDLGKLRIEIFESNFSSDNVAKDVLKALCAQLVLYYTRFQKIVTNPLLSKQFVPSTVIMAEIRQMTSR
jgi:hypothetical protein